MTYEIKVPGVYDNHEIIHRALQPLEDYTGVSCTVFEPAESPDWYFILRFPDRPRVTGVLSTFGRMQPAEQCSKVISNWIQEALASR